jgi:uncharacterized protein YndB with AHSA1/START domain
MVAINVEYSTEINASAERIWDILADVEAWPEWQGTPFVRLKTPTPIREGSVIEVGIGGVKWKLAVIQVERPSKLAWTGKAMGLKAIHEWEFKEHEGKTLAINRESVSGWTSIPLYFLTRYKVPRANKKWLADLNARAESI